MADTRALLLTDVVDSTRLSEALSDAAMAALWTAHDRAARDLLPLHRGREIDKTDGMLLMFTQADDALAYAAAYHAALQRLPQPLQARAGLHVGPVIVRENNADDVARGAKPLEVDGIAKPVAARVMALARGGQTLLSAEAATALAGPPAGELRSHGHWRLKGVAEPVELFEAGLPPFVTPPDGEKGYRVARAGERWLPLRQLPNNLPQQTTSFHGRDREVDEVKTALHASRLVTLLGMGGLGKTRLSLQVAAELLAEFPDGAWFLDLSTLREPALVVDEAARLLQVQEEPAQPLLQTLCTRLQTKRLLLVIDNCEHLVEAAAALAHAVLRAAPQVHLITSSRIALRVPGEQTYPVLPLPVPAAHDDLATLERSAAVQLFVERAQSHQPSFTLDNKVAAQVAALVARLEGIPLALELSAARVRSLSIADINTRLKDRYKLLTGGSRVLQQRQQTLRALVDWSYDLLLPAGQTLFQRLGIFVGGFDLAAAEAVCGAEPLDPLDMLDLVDSLVEESLVMLDPTPDGTRYRMLETLREYAHEKLVLSGDAAATAERHAAHFFVVAKQARDGFEGAQQAMWVRRVEADLDNLRAAMATARAGGADPMLAAKLPVALQGFWVTRGYIGEGRELVRAALALPAIQASDMARAHTLYVGAALAYTQGDPIEAQQLLETCLALRRQMDDTAGVAMTLSTLSMARWDRGDAEAALAAELEALQLFRDLGHHVGEVIGLLHLGHIHIPRSSWDEAREHVEQARQGALQLQNLELEAECELLLGEVALAGGDNPAAAAHLALSLQRYREAGDRTGEAKAHRSLGRCALQADALAEARSRLNRALGSFRDFEMRSEMIEGVEDHAQLELACGDDDIAVRLLAAAANARTGLGLVSAPHDAARVRVACETLRVRLGGPVFERAWDEGLAWSLGDALAAALALPAPLLA
jgi:predicted ATPase/class 3 adenylate cyclase